MQESESNAVNGGIAVGTDSHAGAGHAHKRFEFGNVLLSSNGKYGDALPRFVGVNRHGQPFGKREFREARHGDVNGLASCEGGSRRRQFGDLLAVEFVSDANLQFVEPTKHVKFGQGQTGEPVDALGVSHDDGVKPAAATLSAGRGTEFMTNRAHVFTRLIVEFGGHGAVADTRNVGLRDADDVLHVAGVDACAVGGVAPRGDGGGYVGEGALVNVEKTTLCAFKDDICLLYTSPSPRDRQKSRMPSSA